MLLQEKKRFWKETFVSRACLLCASCYSATAILCAKGVIDSPHPSTWPENSESASTAGPGSSIGGCLFVFQLGLELYTATGNASPSSQSSSTLCRLLKITPFFSKKSSYNSGFLTPFTVLKVVALILEGFRIDFFRFWWIFSVDFWWSFRIFRWFFGWFSIAFESKLTVFK